VKHQPSLSQITVSMSGICTACGDLVLAPPKNIKGNKMDEAVKILREVFDNHIARKHRVTDSTATHVKQLPLRE
jgi:hypothetical protein